MQWLGSEPLEARPSGAGLHRTKADLDGEVRAVLAARFQFEGGAHGARYRVGEVLRAMLLVGSAEGLGHQCFHRLSQQLFAGIAEQLLGHAVQKHDPTFVIELKNCVRSALEKFP